MLNPFTLHPIFYWVGGPAIVAVAVSGFQAKQGEATALAKAFAAEPPEMVRLEGFDPNLNIGVGDEVAILAQTDLDSVFELKREQILKLEKRWAAPLFATYSEEAEPTLSAVLLESEERPTAARLQELIEKNGPIGPVLRLRGRLVAPGPFEKSVADAMGARGMIIAPDVMYIDPFLEGREAAYRPDPTAFRTSVGIGAIGLAVFLYGFLWRWLRRRFTR